ncbi:MAG TPA: protein kinase [Verrucomicrobiae bacterium]|nr:protein kinase [Verrucomicrobiae bacterium]
MADFWTRCEGRVIEHKYPLHQYLGGTPSCGVFLTGRSGAPAEKAVIKFALAHPGTAKLHLSQWARAARLSHPNLLQLLDSGRCGLDGRDLLYVVVEYAEENLSQILPERALTPEETREMVVPVTGALIYLHGQGLAHGHLKPSNVHAIGEQIKLSIDSVTQLGELHLARGADSYGAPELVSSPVTGASDVWSFGVTLVEALTQHVPDVQAARYGDPEVPASLPQPFLDIARHALKRDPAQRWSAANIAAHLKPGHVAKTEPPSVPAASATPAKATPAGISPLDVPLSPERGIPVAKLAAVPPRVMSPQQKPGAPAKKTLLLPNYAFPLLAAIFVVAAIVMLPKFLRHQQEIPPPAVSSSLQPRPETKPADHTGNQAPPAPHPALKDSARAAVEKAPPASPAPAKLRTETAPAAQAAKLAADSPARGDVLDQVLPEVPDKALNTIHGVVRVTVRVHVDAAGNVSQAELEAPGPSRYFADLALTAAGKWVFGSPELEGKSVPSEWLIRFDFAQSGVVASPQQTTP